MGTLSWRAVGLCLPWQGEAPDCATSLQHLTLPPSSLSGASACFLPSTGTDRCSHCAKGDGREPETDNPADWVLIGAWAPGLVCMGGWSPVCCAEEEWAHADLWGGSRDGMSISGDRGSSAPAERLGIAYQDKMKASTAIREQVAQMLWSCWKHLGQQPSPASVSLLSPSSCPSLLPSQPFSAGHSNAGGSQSPAPWQPIGVFSPCPVSPPTPCTALLLHSFSGRRDPTENCTYYTFWAFYFIRNYLRT